jgi:hypothetical protein
MNTLPSYATLDQNNIVVAINMLFYLNTIKNIPTTDSIGISSSFSIVTYNTPDSLIVNEASIGDTLDTTLNAFIPPKPDPNYILNTTTYQWEPDPSLTYDLHNDGKLYRYDSQLSGWIPIWENDSIRVGTT